MLRSWHYLTLALVVLLTVPAAAENATAPVPQLFLLQNSGWMAPFYTDPRSGFRGLVAGLVKASAAPGSPVIIAAFNKDGQVANLASPQLLFKGGNDADAVRKAIDGITLPRKPSGAYADSDFEAALTAGAGQLLGGKPGIIWFVSNNQNAPDGTADWQQRSKAFSTLLLESPQITRVYAHPVRNAANSADFGRKEGFIIYALAYGKAAAPALDALIESKAVRSVLDSPVARLKPIDRQTMRFILDKASTTLYQQDGWVQIVGDGRPQTLTLKGRLENRLYPFIIDSANLRVTFRPDPVQPGLASMALAAQPQKITDVPALGKSAPVTIELALPKLPRQRLLDTERRASGVLSISLTDIRYRWDTDFLDRLSAVPATDTISMVAATQIVAAQLPSIFVAPLSISTSKSDVPLQVIARYSKLGLWLLGLLAAAFVAAILWWRGRGRRKFSHDVDLAGERRRLALARGEKVELANSNGKRFIVKGRGDAAPKVTALANK